MVTFPTTLATDSKKKQGEWVQIFKDLGRPTQINVLDKKPELLELQDIDVVKVVVVKAYDAWRKLRRSVLVEDTGVEIDAWGGFPGALYKHTETTIGNAGLLLGMNDNPNRKVTAKTAIGFASDDGSQIYVAVGVLEGTLPYELKGKGGFGYDPIVCLEDGRSLAELTPEEKNAVSMRFKAISALIAGKWEAHNVSECPLWLGGT